MADRNLFEEIVLGEISGKHAAIHAYDGIIWKIRSGFLVLVFVGWSMLLKGISEHNLQAERIPDITIGLFLVTMGLAVGGWFIDRNYVRRKFRVILAVNELLDTIKASQDNINSIPVSLLQVAGDDAERPFDSSGYKEAVKVNMAIYFGTLPILAAAAIWVNWHL
jgi:hypothetical protein